MRMAGEEGENDAHPQRRVLFCTQQSCAQSRHREQDTPNRGRTIASFQSEARRLAREGTPAIPPKAPANLQPLKATSSARQRSPQTKVGKYPPLRTTQQRRRTPSSNAKTKHPQIHETCTKTSADKNKAQSTPPRIPPPRYKGRRVQHAALHLQRQTQAAELGEKDPKLLSKFRWVHSRGERTTQRRLLCAHTNTQGTPCLFTDFSPAARKRRRSECQRDWVETGDPSQRRNCWPVISPAMAETPAKSTSAPPATRGISETFRF